MGGVQESRREAELVIGMGEKKKVFRVFEGTLHRDSDDRDAYLAPSDQSTRLMYWQSWVDKLEGRRVRITVETIDGTEEA